MRFLPVSCLILVLAIPTCAAGDKIDQYIAAEMKRQHIPGLALGIYSRVDIVRVQGYGLANVELNVPVKPESIFQSGSVGKQFTATAIMMLVEEGKVHLDDSITKYFDRAPAAWKPVKVKNLLSHTSGIAEYESGPLIKPGAPFYLRLDLTEDEMFDRVAALPMDFQPGEKWRYTNTNYLLLGMLIRKVTGQFYGDFLAERIFKPLGMSATRIISEADIVPNRTSGYEWVKGELKNQEWVSPTFNSTADGALYFNVLDLAKWDAALYTEKLIKKTSLDQMWTPFPLNDEKPNPANYGFAWSIDQINGHRAIQHSGAWQGFTTYIVRYVDDGLTVVVLTNLDAGHSNPGRIAHAVAGLYDGRLTPAIPKAIEDTEPQVTAFVRETVERIANGKADPEAFTAETRSRLFPDRVKELEAFLKEAGPPLQRFELIERKVDGDVRSYRYRVIGKDRFILGVRITNEGKIAGMSMALE
jgi:CubicO group peptidase (beta-lactamase class C family)